MNTFYLQLDPNGKPKGWLVTVPEPVDFPDDLLREITGREIRGITNQVWKDLDLKAEVIQRLQTPLK